MFFPQPRWLLAAHARMLLVKKPNLRGSKKQAFGDNIYSRNAQGNRWCQADSHHSLKDGTPNLSNVRAG
jgi:hypothetical protein